MPLGPGPDGDDWRARVALGPRGPREDARGYAARPHAGRVVTVHPSSRGRTCGVELLGPGPGRDVIDRHGS